MSEIEYEALTKETLESLAEKFDEIIEELSDVPEADLALSDGVLTVHLGRKHGTYVINKQTPNRQIWLSSPVSGPKRYDFVGNKWIYKHDGVSLCHLLESGPDRGHAVRTCTGGILLRLAQPQAARGPPPWLLEARERRARQDAYVAPIAPRTVGRAQSSQLGLHIARQPAQQLPCTSN